MRNLLWVGNPYFANELGACGWENVRVHDFFELRTYGWEDLKNIAGFEPDVVVVADKSLPPFVLGMEDFPCLTVFYSVDDHIHSWHPAYARGFDACLVSLKDKLNAFPGPGLPASRVWWSPPYAKSEDAPDKNAEKIWDCLFVGTLDSATMPKRDRFMRELGGLVPGLHIEKGDYRRLFSRARALINQAERGDLNFRVFEAMGCGGCLVTPRVKHGLEDMFIDGEHAVFYVPDDAGDAAHKINFLLSHPDVAEYIGQTAKEEVDRKHRAIHRAQAFTDNLCDLFVNGADEIVNARRKNASRVRKDSLAEPYLLWANEIPDTEIKKAYLEAARKR